jgi:parallel beta-helix repeat protein
MALEGATGSRIERNVLRDGLFGISSLSSSHNRFDGNDTQDADEFGILLWGGSHANLLRDNVADDNGTNGFWTYDVSNGNVLQDNEACGNDEADLRDEAAGTVLLGNDFCTEGVL